MGRKLMRVPLDFNWPHNKLWRGYINPHWAPCPADQVTCFNGSTAAGKWIDAIARFIAILGEDAAQESKADALRARGRIFPHPYLKEFPLAPSYQLPNIVSREMRDMTREQRMRVLAEYSRDQRTLPLGGDVMAGFVTMLAKGDDITSHSGATYKIYKTLEEVGKLPEGWDICPICKGEALDPAVAEAYEAWKDEEPPTGDGYQLWETTSEGSPISPVFASMDALCTWAAEHANTFADFKATAEQWRSMLDKDFVTASVPGTDPKTGAPITLVFM